MMEFEFTTSWIKIGSIKLNAIFSKIYDENGVIYVELHLEDDQFRKILDKCYDQNIPLDETSFIGETIKEDYVKAYRLHFRSLDSKKVKFVVLDRLELYKYDHFDGIKWFIDSSDTIYCVEVENLEIKHCDRTEKHEYRDGEEIKSHLNFHFEHTTTLLISNLLSSHNIDVSFHESKKDGVTQINFHKQGSNQFLSYGDYSKIKKYFFSLLDFLNGRDVVIVKEYCGDHYNLEVPKTEIEIFYSHNKNKNKTKSSFIPLADHENRSANILNRVLLTFDKYVLADDKYNLNPLIKSLNSLNSLTSYEERFKILIIAFEAISTRVLATEKDEIPTQYITNNDFKAIKESFLAIVEERKSKLDKIQYSKLRSKIEMLNEDRSKVMKKLNYFIDFCKIKRTKEIEELINKVRHSSVHEGVISESESEAYKYYTILDDLLRYSILCLIEYKGSYNPISRLTFGIKDDNSKL